MIWGKSTWQLSIVNTSRVYFPPTGNSCSSKVLLSISSIATKRYINRNERTIVKVICSKGNKAYTFIPYYQHFKLITKNIFKFLWVSSNPKCIDVYQVCPRMELTRRGRSSYINFWRKVISYKKKFRNRVSWPNVWHRYIDDTFIVWSHGKQKLQIYSN